MSSSSNAAHRKETAFLLDLSVRVERLLTSIPFWWAVSLLCAVILAWSNRHSMNPDGLSYLDIGSNVARGGIKNLLSATWSPGYPAFISLALLIVRPIPELEFPLVHLVNFAVFALVLWSFTFFLKAWLAGGESLVTAEEHRYMIPFAFGIFLFFMLTTISVSIVTPDLSVAGVVFLAAGICSRISASRSSWRSFLALGFTLGLGYYIKAPILPLGLLLCLLLFLFPPPGHSNRPKIVLTVVVSLLISAPLVVLVSRRAGHPSIGEAARLNYIWFVNGVRPYVGWTGDLNSPNGSPEHPPRLLLDKPRVLEYVTPIGGTYPLWYEPSYWYAGAKPRFRIKEQIAGVQANLGVYWPAILQMSSLFAGAAVLLVLMLRRGELPALDRRILWIFVWPIGAFAMYAAVHLEPRYVGSFLVLFWLAVYSLLGRRASGREAGPVLATVLCTLLIPTAASLLAAGAKTMMGVLKETRPDYVLVADALKAAGVHRGDLLASAGFSLNAYYARCAGARIVAEIVDTQEFEHLDPTKLAGVTDRLSSLGITAIVYKDAPDTPIFEGWKEVKISGFSRYRILMLNPASKSRVTQATADLKNGNRK